MSITIALAGNPNSGKTTLFNALTGSNQYVGNWPGVTVEKKEGKLKSDKDVTITDLPGVYSLSPYTLEEIVARNYLLDEQPDVILNIVDGSNIERNLYLTTQLLEIGIPVVIAINMMDVVRKNGDVVDTNALSKALGCMVIEISAMKGEGIDLAAKAAIDAANSSVFAPSGAFSDEVEKYLSQIEERLHRQGSAGISQQELRFAVVKVFERDQKIAEKYPNLPDCEDIVQAAEDEFDDDAESIITNERYGYISSAIAKCFHKNLSNSLTTSDKIDRIVTNRWLALPIFAVVMFIVYFISVTTVGAFVTDWTNDGLFGDGWHLFGIGSGEYEDEVGTYEEYISLLEDNPEDATLISNPVEEPDPASFGVWVPGIPVLVSEALESVNTADWLQGLIVDGIIGGVGAVLGFVPQILVLFILLAFLEGCGYMSRIAFILDRIFRKFGLSGKSFIPMLIGTGCGIPGIMASRTIENERDRRMTIIVTTFIPCGAKLPVIALIAGALFGNAWWVAPSAYFLGIAAIIASGIILKKTKPFLGNVAPFVMELPSYHLPRFGYVMRSMWERGWSFIKKAGTIILISAIGIWFASSFGVSDGTFGFVENMNDSLLAVIGNAIAWLFIPLGFGDWQSAVATIMGLVAKENVVSTFGVLYGFAEVGEAGNEIWSNLAAVFTPVAGYAFLAFNLLCAPCFAAIGAIRREMNSWKWTIAAVGYQTGLAYAVSMCVYQIGSLIAYGAFSAWTVVSFGIAIMFVYLLARRAKA